MVLLTSNLLSMVLTTISSGVYCDTSNLSFRVLLSPSSWMRGLFKPSNQALESFVGLSELLLWLDCCDVLNWSKETDISPIKKWFLKSIDFWCISFLIIQIFGAFRFNTQFWIWKTFYTFAFPPLISGGCELEPIINWLEEHGEKTFFFVYKLAFEAFRG